MKNEFLGNLEKRINIAKSRNHELSVERIKELAKLKEDMIAWVQKDFMRSIPPIIQTDTITVSSGWLWVKEDGELFNITINQSNVHFKEWDHVDKFLTEVAIELSKIVERRVRINEEAGKQLDMDDHRVGTRVKFHFEYEIEEDVEREEV